MYIIRSRNKVSEDKNSNDDTFVYDAIRDKLGVPIYTTKKKYPAYDDDCELYVCRIYIQKDPKILALCLACLYLNRWKYGLKFSIDTV